MNNTTVFVDCFRDGNLLATFDYMVPSSLAGPAVLGDNEQYISEAKSDLVNARLAEPPFVNITFKMRFQKR